MILVDTGPIVALLSARDRHHRACVAYIKASRDAFGTVWPVITEAVYLLDPVPDGPDKVWEMLERGAIRVLDLNVADVPRIRELMRKYRDLPMDFADAALVRVAEREGIRTIFTIDRKDFALYRPSHLRRFELVPA
jgi:predicted nucleic acid-binding protein